ncbi:uncharacterized protein B0J16DRAFT_384255 [Fusarium flagelliforme]|uniref:uncharacterized protein n=1 Tax=Fusarium flagelliforme TaxID=2675880 RepID=UPI001E8EF30F|nr:uncharacterized protein B0J16DRAFT_384255 [Fusarium flagelliforme]KAH7185197.1 hypothetical protein B0J16DRAFT_384255 [Fusarium flagelliforme]
MERFLLIEEHQKLYGKQCGICGAYIVGGASKLQRHVNTHTGLPALQVINGEATWRQSTTTRLQQQESNDEKQKLPFDKKLVQQMICSRPAKVRHGGGIFTSGPLGGKERFPGMPAVFLKDGRVRPQYSWLKNGLDIRNPFTANQTRPIRRHLRRQCTVRFHPPHRNTRIQEQTDVFTNLVTNLWTPGKFPDWPKPPG